MVGGRGLLQFKAIQLGLLLLLHELLPVLLGFEVGLLQLALQLLATFFDLLEIKTLAGKAFNGMTISKVESVKICFIDGKCSHV